MDKSHRDPSKTEKTEKTENTLDREMQLKLLSLARASIEHGLLHRTPLPVNLDQLPKALSNPGATFVTLTINGALRGCIGTLIAQEPLVIDLVNNAYSAAFEDRRFPALTEPELQALEVHISKLSPPEPLHCSSEAELLHQLRPHIDGILLKADGKSGTFLPSVWEQLPEKERFIRQLKKKAGLPMDYWSDDLQLFRYTVEYWEEDK